MADVISLGRDEGEAAPDPLGHPRLVKATAANTGGAYTLTQSTKQPGLGAPLHFHAEHEEAFYVLEGELTFTVEQKTEIAPAGTFLLVPRGIQHAFDITSDAAATSLCIFSPPMDDRERRSLAEQMQQQQNRSER